MNVNVIMPKVVKSTALLDQTSGKTLQLSQPRQANKGD